MNTNINGQFTESQKFKQPLIWVSLIFSTILCICIYGFIFYKQIILGKPLGNNPMTDVGLILNTLFVFGILISVFLLFSYAKLTTEINKEVIKYKFFPFHLKYQIINWDDIDKYEVVKYNPLRDYGGWGLRYGIKKKAYNVSGDKGLQLYLKNGKKILIGTQKFDELVKFLE